jgi:uncharacterized iron-regulated membrane protein
VTETAKIIAERGRTGNLSGQLTRQLSVWHRWFGIVLCLFFCTWFLTGAMMVFVSFPSLPVPERDRQAEVINIGEVRQTPSQVLTAGDSSLRLISRNGEPAYVIGGPKLKVVSAVTGQGLSPLDHTQASTIAKRYSGVSVDSLTGPFGYDQWVVHNQFDPLRPVYRAALDDKAKSEIYISAVTGEVIQKTTGKARVLNWLGSVIHWIYITPIRSHFWLWDQTVWWIALAGVATVIMGFSLGFIRTNKALKNPKRPRITPFRGWLEWHHKLGLFAGILVLFWIFSGWLSMDHGRLFSRGETPKTAQAGYYGPDLKAGLASVTLADLASKAGVSRIDFNVVAGQPILAAAGKQSAPMLPDTALLKGVAAGWPGLAPDHLEPVGPRETFALAEGLSESTRLARLKDADHTNVYIDGPTGRILVVMNTSRKAYAWVYYALHTWNWPILSDHPLLHNTLILVLLLVGFSFSLTSLVIGVKRLRLTFK